jgi:hypothetical protein
MMLNAANDRVDLDHHAETLPLWSESKGQNQFHLDNDLERPCDKVFM